MNIIIQARCSSTRLPNKVITRVNRFTILEHVINRVLSINMNKNIYVATSDQEEDNQIESIINKIDNIKLFRGNLNDVYDRFSKLIQLHNLNNFIRISGDSPMIDPAIIINCYDLYMKNNYDLVTNKHPRTFPKGQTVEVINSNKFLESKKYISSKVLKEHVTLQMYENNYSILNFFCQTDLSKFNLAIDNQNDLEKFIKFNNFNEENNLELKNIIEFYSKNE